jgi:anti-anti-sigma factor
MLQDVPLPEISMPALNITRLPGEFGPILRCEGELSSATAAMLRRELDRLEPLDHPVLTVNLSACEFLDVDGILTLLQAFKQRREQGRRLVVVTGTGSVARLLQTVGFDRLVPTFSNSEGAMMALRGGQSPLPAPATWEEARDETLTRWRAIQQVLDEHSPEQVLSLLTSMFALCERSEELFQQRSERATYRCEFCPLFHALGGQPEDIGCRSILEPLIETVRANRLDSARAQVAAIIHTIETMPLPEEGQPPVPRLLPASHPLSRVEAVPPPRSERKRRRVK